ncbi:hypothetical protein HNR46_000662 [Haloferula luteola]|uniref:Uncharacterized protein n=1 Tax=Haloferula luteola TaxID=595692 RepID=A0A840V6P3_9BACT|nr:hypothetical protein [Haloferula luteola]MBB5350438.1 hypothetical protein [Haloferula luteola]
MWKLIRRLLAMGFLVPGLLLIPAITSTAILISDPGLRSASPSRFAFQLHRSLSRRIPRYVEDRLASGKAATLSVSQITATEWPVYGAFFYLLATQNLQQQWDANPQLSSTAPKEEGMEAIEASLRLALDDNHAHWVKTYWGDDYLSDPNCFYRMLLIGSITAHHLLTGDLQHLELLRELSTDLATDIDQSPRGLIDDYPDQCFPADVAVGIAMVRYADQALGSDHQEWASAAYRRLTTTFPDSLPPYMARASTGHPTAPSRGCTNGFFFSFDRQLSSDDTDSRYEAYVDHFWRETKVMAGWREFPADPAKSDTLYFDPDSGPVIDGLGTSATGLGLGAARHHADSDRAGKLGAEFIASVLPLPTGRLLLPSLVADHEHAPLFPEIVLLHQISIAGGSTPSPAPIPRIVFLILTSEILIGLLSLAVAWKLLRVQRQPKAA